MSDEPTYPPRQRRAIVSAASKPCLAPGRRLQYRQAGDQWVIQAPERVFTPDAIALAVLGLCDGNRTVAEVADELSMRYTAPKEQILADIVSMLQDLADKGVVRA